MKQKLIVQCSKQNIQSSDVLSRSQMSIYTRFCHKLLQFNKPDSLQCKCPLSSHSLLLASHYY